LAGSGRRSLRRPIHPQQQSIETLRLPNRLVDPRCQPFEIVIGTAHDDARMARPLIVKADEMAPVQGD